MAQLSDTSVIVGKNITVIASMDSYYVTSNSSMSRRVLYENGQVCRQVHVKGIPIVVLFIFFYRSCPIIL